MKVLYVGPYDTKGRYQGGISYIVNTVYKNRNRGFLGEVELESFDTCKIKRSKSSQGKFKLSNLRNTLKIIRELTNKVAQSEIDIIYYNSSYGIPLLKDLIVVNIIGYKSSVKVIFHIHFADYEKIIPNNIFLKKYTLYLIKKNVDHLVFLSKKSRDKFTENGISSVKTSVIYNFHDIKMSQFEFDNKIQKSKNAKKLQLIYLGSLDQRKGILDLLTALKSVDIEYCLKICGESVDKNIMKEIKKISSSLSCGAVEFMGYVSGDIKKEILFQSDVLVLPSYAEGFPIVLLEGIAAANYIISTNVGAIPEVFSANNGIIVEPGNINQLVIAIEECSRIEERIKRMEHNYYMSKEYEIEKFMEKLQKVCYHVME